MKYPPLPFRGVNSMKSLLKLIVLLFLCYSLVGVCTAETEYVRTVIYPFASGSTPLGVAVDSNGDYIVSESNGGTTTWNNALSKIHGSTRSVIYSSPYAMDIYDAAYR